MELEPEQCVPWEPVPPAANRYMDLNVAILVQGALIGPVGAPVSVVIVSRLPDTSTGGESVLAWRITFQFVAAYHKVPIGRSSVVRPHEYGPDGLSRLRIATWEVINSRWLAAHVTPQDTAGRTLHHFVVASSYSIYEIAAESWQVQALGPWLRVRQQLEARWEQDHLAAP